MSRVIPTARETVWQAWTTEPGLATWWWHTWPDTRYRVNAVVGGDYRIEAAEHGIGVRGTYRVVEPPQRLAFSWIWYDLTDSGPSEQPADEVEVTLSPHQDGTLVQVVHSGPWTSQGTAQDYRQGWIFVLDALEHSVPAR